MPPSPITRQLAPLLGREPVDVEQAERAVVAEAQQAGDHVLLRRMREAGALGVDARDVAAQDELHDVQVVGGEVDRRRRRRGSAAGSGPTRVAWARKTRPMRPSVDELGHLADRGVEALDVADHQLAAGRAGGGGHAQAVLEPRGDRLLDQHVLAGVQRRERDRRRACSEGAATHTASMSSRSSSVCQSACQSIGRRRDALPAPRSRSGSATATHTAAAGIFSHVSRWKPPIVPTPMIPDAQFCAHRSHLHGLLTTVHGHARRSARRRSPSPNTGGRVGPGSGRGERRREAVGVDADDGVPARLDRVDPFGLLAQRHAAHAPQVGLALDAARVGGDRLRAALELEHAGVGNGLDQLDVLGHGEAPAPRSARGCAGAPGRSPATGCGRGRRGPRRGARGRRCCSCGAPWRARSRPAPATTRSRRAQQDVAQRVAGHVDLAAHALGLEVAPRALGGREAERRRGGRSRPGCAPRACPRGRSAGRPRRAPAGAPAATAARAPESVALVSPRTITASGRSSRDHVQRGARSPSATCSSREREPTPRL